MNSVISVVCFAGSGSANRCENDFLENVVMFAVNIFKSRHVVKLSRRLNEPPRCFAATLCQEKLEVKEGSAC